MSAKKTSRKPAKKQRSKAAPKPAQKPKATAASPKVVASALDLLLNRADPLTEEERRAFRTQFSDAKCDAMGVRTKSSNVFAEARAWAITIDRALEKFPRELRRYGRVRFAWFLDCVRGLGREIDAQRATEGKGSLHATDLAARRADALRARKELAATLEDLTEGDDQAAEGVANAAAIEPGDDDSLARSLRSLATLASVWLARSRHESSAHVLVRSVGLGEADVTDATAKATSLEEAIVAHVTGERVSARDLPSVNRIEGRVLLEMQRAMRVFDRAREGNKLVPRLIPGPGTRSTLLHARTAKAAEVPSPATVPATPATPPEG